MVIQRSLVPTILSALRASTLLSVTGAPRSGKTLLASQLQARLAPGSLLLNAKRAEAPGLLARSFAERACHYLVCDDADADFARLVAAHQARQEGPGLDPSPIRAILLGGDFAGKEDFELKPLSLFELGAGSWRKHWFRGGFPEAYFALSDGLAMETLRDHEASIASSLASNRRDGLSLQGAHLLLKALASGQGRACNENALALSVGVSRTSVTRAIERLRALGLLRRIEAYDGRQAESRGKGSSEAEANTAGRSAGHRRKRASAVFYLRDQGLAHAILGIEDSADPAMHGAAAAASWQAYVIEQAAAALPPDTRLSHYASADGATLEALVLRDGQALLAASIRRYHGAAAPRGAANAADSLGIARRVVVSPEGKGRELSRGFSELGLPRFLELIEAL